MVLLCHMASIDLSSLPKSIPKLHDLIIVYSQTLEGQTEQIKTQTEQISVKDKQITKLEEEVKLLRKLRFAHKSEKWTKQDNKQSLLFNEAETGSPPGSQITPENTASETITITYRRKKKAGRKGLDPNLPRKEILHDLSDSEKICKCGCALEEISRDYREELDMEPAKYWVNQHIYPQYACNQCSSQPDEASSEVKSTPKDALIPKSFASPGLLAHLFVSKFEDHLPFYRMEKILSRLEVDLPRATMCNWAIKIGERLEPILKSMREDIRDSDLVMADETTLQVMKEPGRKNTTKSYMWAFRSASLVSDEHGRVQSRDRPIVLYEYHPTRSGQVVSNFLEGYEGYLLTDGYGGYNEVGARPGVIHAGCWAHARRKFKEAHDVAETENTRKALSLIQSLYLVEKKIRMESLGYDQILSLRQSKSRVIVEEFKRFLDSLHALPESLLGKAVGYSLNQWSKLTVFLDSPFVPIDNNRIENDIRPFVLGRKNWLFSGSPRGAHASCALYSLIQTAKANGLDPYAYLRYLFEQLIIVDDEEELAKLAPHRVDPTLISKVGPVPAG